MKTPCIWILTACPVLAQGPLAPPAGPPAPGMRTLDQIEARTPLAGGATTVAISQPGSYVLTGNITVSTGDAITITASHVTLDLNGFTLASTASPANGRAINIAGSLSNLSISNGNIRSGSSYTGNTFNAGSGFIGGVDWASGDPNNCRVSRLTVTGVRDYGIDLGDAGNSVATECVVSNVNSFGIRAGAVADSSATLCGSNSIIARTTSNCVASLAVGGNGLLVSGNTVESLAAQITQVQAANRILAGLLTGSGVNFAWNIQTIDSTGSVGSECSLAFGTDGQAMVAYTDTTNTNLKFARLDGTNWQVTTVDNSPGNVGTSPSLAIGEGGQPVIAYYDSSNSDLKLARRNGNTWTTETIPDPIASVGSYCSLAYDSSGLPAISYYDVTNGDLRFARYNGINWNFSSPDSSAANVGQFTSLAFGPDGNPAIAYHDITNNDLKFARYNGSTWTLSTPIGSGPFAGRYISLKFGPAGRPAISYRINTTGVLQFSAFNGNGWSAVPIDGGEFSAGTSLAFGPDGQPSIAYHEANTSDLKFARYNGTTWDLSLVDGDETGSAGYAVGGSVSLAFGPDGQPAMAYYDITNGDLKFARRGIFTPAP